MPAEILIAAFLTTALLAILLTTLLIALLTLALLALALAFLPALLPAVLFLLLAALLLAVLPLLLSTLLIALLVLTLISGLHLRVLLRWIGRNRPPSTGKRGTRGHARSIFPHAEGHSSRWRVSGGSADPLSPRVGEVIAISTTVARAARLEAARRSAAPFFLPFLVAVPNKCGPSHRCVVPLYADRVLAAAAFSGSAALSSPRP